MAKIWFVADGVEIKGKPKERTAQWCKDMLGITSADWRAEISNKFTINEKTPQSDFANPRHVVITIENESGWKDGFYYSPLLRIEEVKKILESN